MKGRGLMRGLDVRDGAVADDICRRAGDGGIILESSGPHDEVVKILAPLTTPDELLARGLDVVADAVAAGRRPVAV